MPREALAHIATEKRERILREAARLFAERGFYLTDMAELARRSEVAKGSLYNYFESKEELYLFVCRDGLARSRTAVWESVPDGADILALIEHVFEAGVRFARAYPEYVVLYLNVASAGLATFVRELAIEVEKPTADRIKAGLRAGIEAGVVDSGIDVPQVAWQINNTYVMFLAALVSQHFDIRLREYHELGASGQPLTDAEIDALKTRVLAFLHSAIQPRGSTRAS